MLLFIILDKEKLKKNIMGGKMMQDPRPINTNIKTKLINPEKEKPSRWSFLKILREHSDLRLFLSRNKS